MRDVRGLFASLGTSALLITAVAVSSLILSAIFAVGGFDDAQGAGSRKALVLDEPARVASKLGADAAPTRTVLVADRVPAGSGGQASSSTRSVQRGQDTAASSAATSTQVDLADGQATDATPNAPPAPPPPPAAATPNLGDSVQTLGDGLSSTLEQTGEALGNAVAPLGPQVSVAVQQIVNFVAALVQQATNGLGALLGGQP